MVKIENGEHNRDYMDDKGEDWVKIVKGGIRNDNQSDGLYIYMMGGGTK